MNWQPHISSLKRTGLVLLVALACGLTATLHQPQGASAVIHIFQVIEPRDCTVRRSTVNGQYSLPSGCGTFFMPTTASHLSYQRTSMFWMAPLMLRPTGAAANLFYGPAPTYLNNNIAQQPLGGYVLLMRLGESYSFQLAQDWNGAALHTMQLASIHGDTVTLRFWPGGQVVKIKLGESKSYDIAFDPRADISMQLLQMGLDGNVVLRVRFPVEPNSGIGAQENDTMILAAALTFIIMAVGINVYVNGWLLTQRGKIPANWWLLHEHDPMRR